MRRPRAAPVRVSGALINPRRLPCRVLAAVIALLLFANFGALKRAVYGRERTFRRERKAATPKAYREWEETVKIFAIHAKENPAQKTEASHDDKASSSPRRPEYWPSNEPWPAKDAPIVGTTDSLPPFYVLRSGRAVRGVFKPFCLRGEYLSGACRHFDGLSISERRETILNMSAARQERLAELGITPEKPVINFIGGKACPEGSVIRSVGEVPECISPYLRREGSKCSIGGVSAHCSHGLGRGTCAYCRDPSARDSNKGLGVVERSRTLLSQFFAKLDFYLPPPSGVGDRIQILAVIVVCAIVIYCVERNNPASADDADAEMVLRDDRFANPSLYTSLLNPPHRRRPGPRQLVKLPPIGGELNA